MDRASAARRLQSLLRQTRPAPLARDWHTGVRALDRLLGAGGLPIGQITEWIGAPSSGKTGALRCLVAAARRAGVAVAWIDGSAALMAADWVDDGAPAPLWVLRPPVPAEALFCAEIVLRTQCFGLVVVDGGSIASKVGVRLQRLARQSSAALVHIRAPERHRGRVVARRMTFQASPPPVPTDALAARAPLHWPIDITRGRGGPADAARLTLVEATPDRVAPYASGPDRPSTRTQAGARYGI